MRTRATVLLTAALLLGACASDPAEPTPTSLAPTTATVQTASPTPAESSPEPEPAPPEPEPESEPEPAPPEPEPEPAPPEPEPEPEPPASAGPATTTVTIADFAYAPESVEVAAGGTVTWTNEDSTAHTATVTGGPNTGAISGGSSGAITFEAAGTYDYVCQFHPGSMTGTVVVR